MVSTSAAKQSSATKKFPNWVDLPDELTANILERLRNLELLKGARKVCTTWRRICKNPALWKVIHVNRWDVFHTNCDLETLTKQAVDLSGGELIDISIRGFGNDDLLDYIVLRSSKLNRLRIGDCKDITGIGLSRAVKKLPHLEKLHLSHTSINAQDIEVIGRNCPQLKSFVFVKRVGGKSINCNDNALAIAKIMPELRHLELDDKEMTNDGLEAIVKGCPYLESLDVGMCFSLELEGTLLVQVCMERIKKFIWDSTGEDRCYYNMAGCDYEYDYYPGDLDFDVDDSCGYDHYYGCYI